MNRTFRTAASVGRYVSRLRSRREEEFEQSPLTPAQAHSNSWSLTACMAAGLLAFAVFMMPSSGTASGFNVLTAIISTAASLGNTANQISSLQSGNLNYSTQVVAPASMLSKLTNKLSSLQQTIGSRMNLIQTISIRSASLPQSAGLESAMYGSNPSAIRTQYNSVFCGQPTNVNSSIANRTDLADATANEALALAANSDNYGTYLIHTAGQLQASASTSAPGNADMVQAQAQILQLHSAALQHKLLASMLRTRAEQAAARGAELKELSNAHKTVTGNFQSVGGN